MHASPPDHGHAPVLLSEVIAALALRPGETVVDCTVGRGGHAVALAQAVGDSGLVVGLDLDRENLDYAARRVRQSGGAFAAVHDSFAAVQEHVLALGRRADAVLADLGFSSSQMDDPQRGFSFAVDAPLDMRFDRTAPITAADLVNTLSERELADLIDEYGEEPLARSIARKLAQNRKAKPIRSTARLARLVIEAYGRRARSSKLHPATRTFMALRIATNDELGALRALLEQVERGAQLLSARDGWLNPGARVAVISFHSLEDRLVKQAFASLCKSGLATPLTPGGKPVGAAAAELKENPRARSAKLRAVRIERIEPHVNAHGDP